MVTKRQYKRITALILSVLMLFSVLSVMAFASEEGEYAYYFTEDEQTEVYITGFKGVVPSDGIVVIPDTVDGYPVVGLAEHTFDNLQELTGIIAPDTVVYIDDAAFYNCPNLKTIQYKSEVDNLDEDGNVEDTQKWYEDHKQDYVINGTTLLSYQGEDEIVAIPYNCTAIADGAFQNNTTIKTVYIEKEITSIGAQAFAGCTSLENLVIGNGVGTVEIGKDAFTGTPWLKNYPSSFVIIGTTLVKYKGSDDIVNVPNVITAIAADAFYTGASTQGTAYRVKLPVTVTSFGEDCLYLYQSVSKVYPEVFVYEGSAAEEYCSAEGIFYRYSALPGDVNLDGRVGADDARLVLRFATNLELPADDEVENVADITGDDVITAEDARMILRISAKIEEYNIDDLLLLPRTDYEILLTSARTLETAKAYGCAYSLFAYQTFDASGANLNTRTFLYNPFGSGLVSENKAVTVTYNQGSEEANDNLFDITLLDPSKIETAACALKDGNYIITIVLKDETINGRDVEAEAYTGKMFPVQSVAYFTNKVADSYWFDNVDYDLTYSGCTLEMSVASETGRLNYMNVVMNYDFSATGKINGITVHGSDGAPATATRTDTMRYSSFVYFSK